MMLRSVWPPCKPRVYKFRTIQLWAVDTCTDGHHHTATFDTWQEAIQAVTK